MPCSCKDVKVVYARELTPQEAVDFRKKIEQYLQENPLYSKRTSVEPKPEFVPPPPLETIGAGELKHKPSNTNMCDGFNEVLSMLKTLWFLVIGFALGYLYATSYVS